MHKAGQKGGGPVRALCHDACPCTCARPMPTHFCYAPCHGAGADFEAINFFLNRSRGCETSLPWLTKATSISFGVIRTEVRKQAVPSEVLSVKRFVGFVDEIYFVIFIFNREGTERICNRVFTEIETVQTK